MSRENVILIQLRVIGALVLRETRATFGTSQVGYLWALIVPTAATAVLVAVFGAIGRQPPYGHSLALFFATGVFTLEFFNKLSGSLLTVFEANRALLTYPLIKEPDAVFARTVLIGTTYALIMTIFFGALAALDLAEVPANPGDLLGAFLATTLLGLGFGMTNAVIVSVWDSWRHIEKILTRPLFFLSGVFFVPNYMPSQAVEYLWWNPVLHLVEWLRNGIYSSYDSRVLDKSYLFSVCLCLLFFGFAGERFTRKRRSGG